MSIWKMSDGPIVHLFPSRVLNVGSTRHAFGQLANSPSFWPEFRISSPVLEEGTLPDNGLPFIRTRSRIYVVDGQTRRFHPDAISQLCEFLGAWQMPECNWGPVLSQLDVGREHVTLNPGRVLRIGEDRHLFGCELDGVWRISSKIARDTDDGVYVTRSGNHYRIQEVDGDFDEHGKKAIVRLLQRHYWHVQSLWPSILNQVARGLSSEQLAQKAASDSADFINGLDDITGAEDLTMDDFEPVQKVHGAGHNDNKKRGK